MKYVQKMIARGGPSPDDTCLVVALKLWLQARAKALIATTRDYTSGEGGKF
jgi:hypothetical protein